MHFQSDSGGPRAPIYKNTKDVLANWVTKLKKFTGAPFPFLLLIKLFDVIIRAFTDFLNYDNLAESFAKPDYFDLFFW